MNPTKLADALERDFGAARGAAYASHIAATAPAPEYRAAYSEAYEILARRREYFGLPPARYICDECGVTPVSRKGEICDGCHSYRAHTYVG